LNRRSEDQEDESRRKSQTFQHGAAENRIDGAPSARGETKIPEYKSCCILALDIRGSSSRRVGRIAAHDVDALPRRT